MALTKYKLGELLGLHNEKCGRPNLTSDDVSGINRDKEFFEPSKQVGRDTRNYKVVPQGYFACNLMHVGRDKVLPVALNHSKDAKYVSPAYTVFYVKGEEKLLKEYFFIALKSTERDRLFWFCTDSSVRDGMSWADFCEIEISLPPLPVQQKYVDVYNALYGTQQAYECGTDDLKLTCDGYLENLRRTTKCEEVGKYIRRSKEINSDLSVKKVVGLFGDIFKRAKRTSGQEDFARYQIIKKGYIVYPPPHFGEVGTIGLYNGDEDALVSPMYVTLESADKSKLLPEYMILWFRREEFKRYAFFVACTSIRDTFDYEMLCEYKIPVPPIDVQQAVANIYCAYMQRRKINEQLKIQLQSICPILTRGSIEEA